MLDPMVATGNLELNYPGMVPDFIALCIWSLNHNISLGFGTIYHTQVITPFVCENLRDRSGSVSMSSQPQCLATCFALTRYAALVELNSTHSLLETATLCMILRCRRL